MKNQIEKPTVSEIAKKFGCSTEQVKAQFRKNAAHLRCITGRLESGAESISNYKVKDIETIREAAENYEKKASV